MNKLVNNIEVKLTAKELKVIEDTKTEWHKGALDRALTNLREQRNSLLAKTDWTSSSDLTMSDAMKTYRQQLRDAPTGLDTVEKVEAYTFPTEVLK